MSENQPPVNLLAIVTVANEQLSELTKKLVDRNIRFTLIDSSSGLLQEATACLLIGLHMSQYDLLIQLIQKCCQRRRKYIPAVGELSQFQSQPMMIEAEIGGASVYTLDVEYFEQF